VHQLVHSKGLNSFYDYFKDTINKYLISSEASNQIMDILMKEAAKKNAVATTILLSLCEIFREKLCLRVTDAKRFLSPILPLLPELKEWLDPIFTTSSCSSFYNLHKLLSCILQRHGAELIMASPSAKTFVLAALTKLFTSGVLLSLDCKPLYLLPLLLPGITNASTISCTSPPAFMTEEFINVIVSITTEVVRAHFPITSTDPEKVSILKLTFMLLIFHL
jgi:hypothetical protein